MSKVQEITTTIERLKPSAAELQAVRDTLDDMLEDELKFTPEFEAKIRQSERDMAEGRFTRTRGGPGK